MQVLHQHATFSSFKQSAGCFRWDASLCPARTTNRRRRKLCVSQQVATLQVLPSTRNTITAQPKQQRDFQRLSLSVTSGDEAAVAFFVALSPNVLSPQGSLGYEQALRVGLRALRLLGVAGISVDVLWGAVEAAPLQYNWSGYKLLFDIIVDMGFKLKVNLCFNSTEGSELPQWIHDIGADQPDIWFSDKSGLRCKDCLSIGIDEIPCLHGRTPIQVYRDFMQSFEQTFSSYLNGSITDLVIGLGPDCTLKYPSHPADATLWEYPGVGEFQCYDKFMLARLKACAQQVQQPPWGLGGPHDAGGYKWWPHQSGFFAHNGSWCSPYGRFFLQWYSEMLTQHANRVMSAASDAFSGHPVQLNARIPGCYWWYNTSSHAAELTAGYYNTGTRDGYLPVFQALSTHNAGVLLSMGEARTSDTSSQHCSDPERLLAAQRTAAAALHMPVTIENSEGRFDEGALHRLLSAVYDPVVSQGIDIPRAKTLVFNRMSDVMFEPTNWHYFKTFVKKVRQVQEDTAAVPVAVAKQ